MTNPILHSQFSNYDQNVANNPTDIEMIPPHSLSPGEMLLFSGSLVLRLVINLVSAKSAAEAKYFFLAFV